MIPARRLSLALASVVLSALAAGPAGAQATGPVRAPAAVVEPGPADPAGSSIVLHDSGAGGAARTTDAAAATAPAPGATALEGSAAGQGAPSLGPVAATLPQTVIVVGSILEIDPRTSWPESGAFGLARFGVGTGARAGLGLGPAIRIAPGITDGVGPCGGRFDRTDRRTGDVITVNRHDRGRSTVRIGHGPC